MKRRISLSIAIVLGVVILALINSDSTTRAQPGRVFVSDSGVVTLGPNQILRTTVANGLAPATVRLRRLDYTLGICSGGVCKHSISAQTVSDPITLAAGEAASYNEGDTATHVRAVVTTNRQGVKVLFQVINTLTGEVVTSFLGGGDDGSSI